MKTTVVQLRSNAFVSWKKIWQNRKINGRCLSHCFEETYRERQCLRKLKDWRLRNYSFLVHIFPHFKKTHRFLSTSLSKMWITNFKFRRNRDHCIGPLWTVVFWKENKIKLFHVFWNVLSSVLYCEVPETMNQTKMDPSSTDDPATCVLFDCGSSINLSHCIKMPSVAGILIHFSFFLRLVYGISVSK